MKIRELFEGQVIKPDFSDDNREDIYIKQGQGSFEHWKELVLKRYPDAKIKGDEKSAQAESDGTDVARWKGALAHFPEAPDGYIEGLWRAEYRRDAKEQNKKLAAQFKEWLPTALQQLVDGGCTIKKLKADFSPRFRWTYPAVVVDVIFDKKVKLETPDFVNLVKYVANGRKNGSYHIFPNYGGKISQEEKMKELEKLVTSLKAKFVK